MKQTILFLLVLMCIPVCMGLVTDTWYPHGNDDSYDLNYQTGSSGYRLGITHSLSITSVNTSQPLISDLDGDGDSEVIIFTTGNIYVYDMELNLLASLSSSRSAWTSTPSANYKFIYDISEMNSSDIYKDISVIDAPQTTRNLGYFEDYIFNGTGLVLRKSIPLYTHYNVTSEMKCGIDFNDDGTKGCYFVAEGWNRSNITLVGLGLLSTIHAPIHNITLSTTNTYAGSCASPQFIDANDDGYLEGLFACYQNIYVMFHNNTFTNLYVNFVGDVKWYQKDSGNYEIVALLTNGGNELLKFYDISLGLLSQSDPIKGGVTPYGSIVIPDIEQGTIYTTLYNSGVGVITSFNSAGTILSNKTSPLPVHSRGYLSPFVMANMKGDSSPEFITSQGVVDRMGSLYYHALYGSVLDNIGYCIPFTSGSSYLKLMCNNGTSVVIMDEFGLYGDLYNNAPTLYNVAVDNLFPMTDEPVGVTINADDLEDDNLYYAIDCDSEGLSSVFSVPLLNEFSCSWGINGTHTIQAYVRDDGCCDSTDVTTWVNKSVVIQVGSGSSITPCFSPYILCDDFNYYFPLTSNDWYVTSLFVLGWDTSVVPISNRVSLPEDDVYYLGKYYQTHKFGIITAEFNASFNTSGNDGVEFVIGNSNNPFDMDSAQVVLRFSHNNIYAVFLENSDVSVNKIGEYSNNSVNKYKVQVFYDTYTNIGNLTSPRLKNTYDVYRSGVLLSRGNEFYHGSTPNIYHPNVTDDFVSYSDYISITSEWTNFTLDDVYVYKGTDSSVDNLPSFDNPRPVIEWDEINEYFGCIVMRGDPNLLGKFDCNYKAMNCQECCGYVDGEFKVVKSSCAYTKAGRQYADKFQKWVFKNMWIFMVFVFIGVVYFMLTRPRRRN